MFRFVLNIYGSYFKSIYHSDLLIHQSYPVAQPFPTLALYPRGDTEPLVFVVTYDNIYYISESIQTHIIFEKVPHQIGRNICDPHHHFAAIQGTECVNFCNLWEGVCKDLF